MLHRLKIRYYILMNYLKERILMQKLEKFKLNYLLQIKNLHDLILGYRIENKIPNITVLARKQTDLGYLLSTH